MLGRLKHDCAAALEVNETIRSQLAAAVVTDGHAVAGGGAGGGAGGRGVEQELYGAVAGMKRECVAALDLNHSLRTQLVTALAGRGDAHPDAGSGGTVGRNRTCRSTPHCMREMPTLRCSPSIVKPGEDDYAGFCRAVRAKFDSFDTGNKGVLRESDAVQLVVHLFSSINSSSAKHLSTSDCEALAAKVLQRCGKKDTGTLDFDEFLSWFSEVNVKLCQADAARASVDPDNLQVWER